MMLCVNVCACQDEQLQLRCSVVGLCVECMLCGQNLVGLSLLSACLLRIVAKYVVRCEFTGAKTIVWKKGVVAQ